MLAISEFSKLQFIKVQQSYSPFGSRLVVYLFFEGLIGEKIRCHGCVIFNVYLTHYVRCICKEKNRQFEFFLKEKVSRIRFYSVEILVFDTIFPVLDWKNHSN